MDLDAQFEYAKPNLNLDQIYDIEFESINHADAPDYSDSYIITAWYEDRKLSDIEIESLPIGFVYEKLMEHLNG